MKNYLRMGGLMLLAAAALSGCSSDNAATYSVTVTNVTGGQVFAEPLVVVSRPGQVVFAPGQSASVALERLAEAGDAAGFVGLAASGGSVTRVFALDSDIAPGQTESTTFEIKTSYNGSLSVLARLASTDDGFAGLTGISLDLFHSAGDEMSWDVIAWDAGTAENLEGPGLGTFSFSRPSGPSGLAGSEYAVVTAHPGIVSEIEPIPGNASTVDGRAKFDNPVARVSIRRL